MLIPSYSDLMEVIKQNEKLDSRVTSRYTVVLAAARRARQLTDGAHPLTYAPTDRAVSTAVKEMHEGKLRLHVQENLLNEDIQRVMRDRKHYVLSKDDLREELKQDYSDDSYSTDRDRHDGHAELFPVTTAVKDPPSLAKDDMDDDSLYVDKDDLPSGRSGG